LSERGINTEHIYPRSKGASEENGNAFSDLHHLAPSKGTVNTARLNHPFLEIDDDRTKRWFRKDQEQTAKPNFQEIDEFSELYEFTTSSGFIIGEFEPRESVKGDIARSIFYFFTMYKEEALRADDDYFEEMRQHLCNWHLMDPISDTERNRSRLVAAVQDGKENPFVLDCSVAMRTHCSDFFAVCENMTVNIVAYDRNEYIKIAPNPSSGWLNITSTEREIKELIIYNTQGQMVFKKSMDQKIFSEKLHLQNGLYTVLILDDDGHLISDRLMVQK
jgi:endonuclease I